MSRYQPVFPTSSSPEVYDELLPSSVSSTYPRQETGYLEGLAVMNSGLAKLSEELSPEPSPVLESNVQLIRERLTETLRHANHNTSSAKWTHVTRSLRMACTRRRYIGVADGVVMGERQEVSSGDYEWVLPETEEQWEDCERRWEKRSIGPPPGEGRTSKFFANGPAQPKARAGELNIAKAEQVRDKVKRWQAKIAPVPEIRASTRSGASAVADVKGNRKDMETKRQSPLPFPVAKHATVASTSKLQGASDPQLAKASTAASALRAEDGPRTNILVSTADEDAIQIADVSEMSFLPPSFPTHLATSTPPPGERVKPAREKPPPILRPSFDSSPFASPRLPKSSLERIEVPLVSSASLPVITSSPQQQPGKRVRPITPPTDDYDDDFLPALKKARTHAGERVSSVPLPPSSTPPLTSATPPETPPRALTGKGLGNAKGLPIPSTPYKPNIPTLTELLASSRRSKPRPRPPSRKSKSRGTTPALVSAHKDELPVANTVQELRAVSPAPSAPRTLLSSPASGSSSSSPNSIRYRPQPPVSPLFSQNVDTFAPPFVSTQVGALGGQNPGVLLGRGGSGLVGMGYNSQFDVEGQVGMVSDLLERDVDFDGWLRDMPEVDAEP